MSIEAECPACGNKGVVPDTYQGRQVRCPRCQGSFVVKAAPQPAPRPPQSGKNPLTPSTSPPSQPARRPVPARPKPSPEPEEIIEAEIMEEEGDEERIEKKSNAKRRFFRMLISFRSFWAYCFRLK